MSPHTLIAFGPLDLVAAALSLPLFSLVLAGLLVACGLLLPRLRSGRADSTSGGTTDGTRGSATSGTRGSANDSAIDSPTGSTSRSTTGSTTRATTLPAVAERHLPERLALGIGALLVIAVYAVENIVRGYLLNLSDIVEWWQYATPLFAAVLVMSLALVLICTRGSRRPEQPVVPISRRTWLSFGPRGGLIGAVAALVALVATTVAAGLASSSDDRGRFIYLEIPVPNTQLDPLRPWFYGWAYGVPVLVCLAALALVTWAALRQNALRPFLRPDTVTAERSMRGRLASAVVAISTAASLLALGGAFRFIGRYGSMSQLTVGNGTDTTTYDMVWQYAEFATAAHWLAPVLEILGFALLLLAAIRMLRRPLVRRQGQRAEQSSTPESVR